MRALILSDIHANLEALNAVLEAAAPFDLLWNLGDVVGYGASPNEVIERIRPHATVNVRGNHDRACAATASSLGFNPIARAAALWTHRQLTADNLAWLVAMPQGPVAVEEHGVSCAHGSPGDEDNYLLNVRDALIAFQQMKVSVGFFGHTHLQGGFTAIGGRTREIRPAFRSRDGQANCLLELVDGARTLVNPGSVGQPRDCDWRAAFAIYDTDVKRVTFHRVPYDITSAQGRILMAGLPERLAARLREGR